MKSSVSSGRGLRQSSEIVKSQIRAGMIDAISSNDNATSDGGATGIKLSVHRRQTYERLMLRSFQYTTLYDREQNIKDAHGKTFQWVFSGRGKKQHAYNNLQDWLQSPEQVYWITGKPGSGKTTLMKFITSTLHDEIAFGYLPDKSSSKSYIMASFYF